MSIPGKATATGTEAYGNRFGELIYRVLGETGLAVSEAGFGGYRVDVRDAEQRGALRHALLNGINLIDTSTNYADGRSELLVGRVLGEMIAQEELAREEVVVVSKIGYVQGENLTLAQEREQAGNPFPEMVKVGEGIWHCIHPEFLADQLERSLHRLNLETLDVCLLHNPEYYLKAAEEAGHSRRDASAAYYDRIERAFRHLETEAAAGRIQFYGVSSNTFPGRGMDFDFTALAHIWQIAEEIDPAHHFRVIQMPLNLFEPEAAVVANQPERQTTLQFAQTHGLGVLINRPLNAFRNQHLIRLADVAPPSYPATVEEVSTAVDTLIEVEVDFQREILPELGLDPATEQQLMQYLSIGRLLFGQWRTFATFHNWRNLQARYLLPRAQSALNFLSEQENLSPAPAAWLERYVNAVDITFAAVSAFYQEESGRRAALIQEIVGSIAPDWVGKTLSQTAVRALRATEGVTSVLVGMRRVAYVDDVLADLKRPVTKEEYGEAWTAVAREVTRRQMQA